MKLNYLHRMSARALCVLTWVHAAGRVSPFFLGSMLWLLTSPVVLLDDGRVRRSFTKVS